MMASVIHVTSWLSSTGGGIPPVIYGLTAGRQSNQPDCTILGLSEAQNSPEKSGVRQNVVSSPITGPRTFGFWPQLRNQLRCCALKGSIIHVHGLWMYPGWCARNVATSLGLPLVISPHGMLEPWALANSRWKKQLAGLIFEKRNLRSAACLHALCRAEATHMRAYGLRNPIAVIPNGVALEDLASLPSRALLENEYPSLKGRRRMLFLSRIHPKKGLPHLLNAWKRLAADFSDWTLLIAGGDESGHEHEMRSLSHELGLANTVMFLGPLHGEAKKRVLAGSDAFVLPSFSEGFSMAVLEAAAHGLPILLTPQCNFPELSAGGAAIEMHPDAGSCENGLRQLFSISDAQRCSMGSYGRALIQKNYTWPVIAARMADLYAWLLGEGPKPECVSLN